MKTATEIVRFAPYGQMHIWCEKHQCRHPIDKPCDASAQAYRLEFEAEDREAKRQAEKERREKAKKEAQEKDKQNQQSREHAPVEKTDESLESLEDDPEASAEAMKAKFAEDDEPKQPPRAEVAKLVRAWVEAGPEAKREFVRERWDEIARARKQLDANGAAHEERWIETDR
jgi:hypothetical protein